MQQRVRGICKASSDATRWCAYPDAACPGAGGGYRWSTTADPDLASQCFPTYELTVDLSGGGGGTVTSDPAAIACDGTNGCSAEFADGVTTTLAASPNGDSRFMGWAGAGASCGTASTCTIAMTVDAQVTASFVPIPEYDVFVTKAGSGVGTISSEPTGIDCGAVCQSKFREGTSVTFRALAGTKSVFREWSGACASFGSNLSCNLTVNAPTAVTASFDTIPDYSISVEFPGDDATRGTGRVISNPAGIDCTMGPCVAAFENGTQVTLTASPTGQSRFDGWGGAAAQCQSNATCVLTVTAPLIVSATFTKIPMRTLTVAKNGDGSGTVTSTPGGITCGTFCSAMFLDGTSVKLTAALDPGNVFLGWSGNAQAEACQTQGDCIISINSDTTVRARFEKTGTALWLTTFGGANEDIATAVASDSAGNVYLAGKFRSPIDFGCANCSFTPRGDSDVFLVKLSRDDGTAIWAKSFGGVSTDIVSAIAVDLATGDVAVFGTFRGTANFGGSDLQGDINGTFFVARYRGTDGQHSWSRRVLGELFQDDKAAVAFDQQHDIVVTATFGDFIDFEEPGGHKESAPRTTNAFTAKLAGANASLVWLRASNVADPGPFGIAGCAASGLAIDTFGNAVISGSILGRPASFGGGDSIEPGAFLVVYSKDGAHLLSKNIGPATFGSGMDVAVDTSENDFIVSGWFSEVDLGSAFVGRYTATGEVRWEKKFSGPWLSMLATHVARGVGVFYDSSNRLRVQVGGYFKGSITIGTTTLTSNTGVFDAFTTTLDENGNPIWVQKFGGPDGTQVYDVGIDTATHRLLIAGSFAGIAKFGNKVATSANGSSDAFVVSIIPIQ